MVGKRFTLFLLMLFIAIALLGAAENPIVEMQLLPTLAYVPATDSWMDGMASSLKLTIPSAKSGNVRGEVILKGSSLSAIASLDDVVYKAYFKARFPSFKLTVGKTRLSWGDGTLFNAADVLYGSSSTSVSLTQAELRSTTGWMASVNYPLGFFSFAEAVILPSSSANASEAGAGFRLYTTVADVKVETGYLTKVETSARVHKPYISLQGNIGPDWYLSSSLSIPQSGDIASKTADSWMISGGLYQLIRLEGDRNIGLRLEFLTRPFGNWAWAPVSDDSTCALLLYPEISYAPTSSLGLSLRGIVSPLDFSASLSAGASWSVYDGFSLVAYLSSPMGDTGDLFSWKGITSAATLSIGSSWIF